MESENTTSEGSEFHSLIDRGKEKKFKNVLICSLDHNL